ncbi:Re/Si-specific NAD(P)(+) transhydrogenase subunit alpha [candidate division KSB1 bacterium]|nr:Re/Si-specific NAD(P)(+) transhydrogenase subunit alpha [candidate division KSB1 bacterium]
MKIGIPKEISAGETRVALVPSAITALTRNKHTVLVEAGAGVASSFSDSEYQSAGATIVGNAVELYRASEIIFKLNPPQMHPQTGKHEVLLMNEGATYIGFLAPFSNLDALRQLAERRITSFAMEFVPRLTRAQSMDALSSMATVAGYKAVLMAAHHLGKFFPLLMTAAGTIPPATVLVLGAGVAGLQAIATAKRLGAKVEAFDPRPAVKEQVKSLGANFIDMEVTEQVETAGGYAKEQSEEFLRKEREVIAARLPKADAVICTAQVFGKRAPVLLTKEMVHSLRPGSVIVDLAAESGGNCELTVPRLTAEINGVSIIGAVNLASALPVHASQMYAKNITNLFLNIFPKDSTTPNFDDEITQGSCITRDGEIVNAAVRNALQAEGARK